MGYALGQLSTGNHCQAGRIGKQARSSTSSGITGLCPDLQPSLTLLQFLAVSLCVTSLALTTESRQEKTTGEKPFIGPHAAKVGESVSDCLPDNHRVSLSHWLL